MKKRNNTAAENAVRVKAPCTLDAETRALLTRAAKAAGIEIVEWVGDQANVNMDGGHYGWNPLASWGQGEALSLAVKLRLSLVPLEGGGWDVERYSHDYRGVLASCANSGMWALQEAIVRAAAAIGTRGVAVDAASSLAQRVTDLHEKAQMPLDQARELALSERGITTQRIDAVARQHFIDMHGDPAEEWGDKSLNAQWLEAIGRPYARSLLVAFGVKGLGDGQ